MGMCKLVVFRNIRFLNGGIWYEVKRVKEPSWKLIEQNVEIIPLGEPFKVVDPWFTPAFFNIRSGDIFHSLVTHEHKCRAREIFAPIIERFQECGHHLTYGDLEYILKG